MALAGVLDPLLAFLRSEVENVRRYDVPWRKRLWLYRNGFLSSRDAHWSITRETIGLYLSDLEQRAVSGIDSPYDVALKDKVLFHVIVSRTHDHLLPEVYGLIRDGAFVGGGQPGWVGSIDEIEERLTESAVVVKPSRAAKADGVRILDRRDGQLRIDGRPVDRSGLVESLTSKRELLLTEHVRQAGYAADIYPDAINTLRLLTMIDPGTGDPFLARATHRFGTRSSGHVDNWSAGGISADVDLDEGELGPAALQPVQGPEQIRWVEGHPDTDAPIRGVSIPNWERIVETVLDLAAEYGWLWPHVGWDIVVPDESGSVVVLEGDPQSVDADQQAHDPLLDDARVRGFYEHHGVLGSPTDMIPV